jgi:hypothetical protein
MKRLHTIILAMFTITMILASSLAQAQNPAERDPARGNPLFSHTYRDAVLYTNSTVDTVPQPTAAGVALAVRAAPYRLVTAVVFTTDSVAADVVFKYRIRGSATWTTALTDTLVGLTTSNYREYKLRTGATDNLGGIDGDVLCIITHRATLNGTAGGAATKKLSFRYVYSSY